MTSNDSSRSGIRFPSDDTPERLIPALLKIAQRGLSTDVVIVDNSSGTGRAYLDLEDTGTGELLRLELTIED